MKTFLQLVAADLYELFGGNYAKVRVVFPNKRAGLFMNRWLMTHATDRAVMTPHYLTIDDLFKQVSDLVVADPIYLVAELYEVYKEVTNIDEGLDRFYAWGELLLSDFEDIDNNMVDAKSVFQNIEDLDELTNYDYLSEEQQEAIRQFFNVVRRKESRDTELQRNFQSVWQHLYRVYDEFRNRLKSKGWAYKGMMKREAVEHCKSFSNGANDKDYTYCFVGFGVLNETERQLFKAIKGEFATLFYWDYDNAYLETEAGMFVRENMRLFPNRFTDRDYYDNMRTEGKKVKFVASATEDAGCRYLASDSAPEYGLQTAIVLCNEKVLGSVLHSLSAVKGLGEMNVTMGYPLMNTPIYSLMAALNDVQVHGRTKSGNWRYSAVATLLRHPYAALLTEGTATEALAQMNHQGMRFPTDEYLQELGVGNLFPKTETVEELADFMIGVVEGLKCLTDTLAIESVFETFTTLNRLKSLIGEIDGFTHDMFGRLLLNVLRSRTIPFHGEPAVGLQVMGLLETRNLDFDNVIMLSVNEGQIPKIHMNNSFIPYTLRAAYGMTTIERQNALYAYYFYRLIQRARNVTFVYNTSTEGINKGEMSRFLLQLQLEKGQLFAPDVEFSHTTLSAGNELKPMKELDIKGGPEVLEKICRRFDTKYDEEYSEAHNGKKMTLSPSAINEFISCPRRFFLHYVAELQTTDDMDDMDIDDATFGTLFHECMEKIYRPMVGRQVQSCNLEAFAKDNKMIERVVDAAFARHVFKTNIGGAKPSYNGHQLLNRHVLIQYVKRQLQYDAQTCPFRLNGLEHSVYTVVQIGEHKVRIGGVIDRSQMTSDDRLCVIDYKTSVHPQTAKDIDSLFDGSKALRAYHILQALYYCDVLAEQGEKRSVYPQLMYVKQSAAARESAVKIGKDEISDFKSQYKEEYHQQLMDTVERIFNPDTEFSATQVAKNCEYCDFKNLCGR